MIRLASRLATLVTAALLSAGCAHADGFLKAIDDVPLVDGVTEAANPVVFNSTKGRVVRTSAAGNADFGKIRDFYIASLPPLGWTREDKSTPPAGQLIFARGDERLTISIEPAAGKDSPVNVIFELVAKVALTKLPE